VMTGTLVVSHLHLSAWRDGHRGRRAADAKLPGGARSIRRAEEGARGTNLVLLGANVATELRDGPGATATVGGTDAGL